MDSGRRRQRLRFSTEIETYSVQWSFTGAEFATFKEFFRDDLQGGTLFFTITLPLGADPDFEDMSLRFLEGKYASQYKPHDTWVVTATLEREVTQAIPDPAVSPVPLWYRPIVPLISDFTASALVHKNALFQSNPGAGNQHIITVPAIEDAGDRLPIGVELTGPGTVVIRTEGEEGGGGDPDPSLLASLLSKLPWSLYDSSTVVETSGTITEWTDLSGNNRHLTDTQASANRARLISGAVETDHTGPRAFRGELSSGNVVPNRFHAFMILEARAGLLSSTADNLNYFSCFSAPNASYSWQLTINAENNWTANKGFATTQQSFVNGLDASKKILVEMLYSSTSKQGGATNGIVWDTTSSFPHASFNWSKLYLGASSNNFFHEQAGFFNLCIFDTTGGNLSRTAVEEIRAAYALEYPDTRIDPMAFPA